MTKITIKYIIFSSVKKYLDKNKDNLIALIIFQCLTSELFMKFIAKKIYKEIQDAESILVVMHKQPDGDALGSSLAMFDFLKRNKEKKIHVYSSTKLPENLKFLPGIENIIIGENNINCENFELIIVQFGVFLQSKC